jgi:hypothetical protein
MRQCPTIAGDLRPLIVQCIDPCSCLTRQSEHYHKCHRCLYRGQSIEFALEPRQVIPMAETSADVPGVPTLGTKKPRTGKRKVPAAAPRVAAEQTEQTAQASG